VLLAAGIERRLVDAALDWAFFGATPRRHLLCKSRRRPVHGLNAILRGLCGQLFESTIHSSAWAARHNECNGGFYVNCGVSTLPGAEFVADIFK
jgi:hypothetical protein